MRRRQLTSNLETIAQSAAAGSGELTQEPVMVRTPAALRNNPEDTEE